MRPSLSLASTLAALLPITSCGGNAPRPTRVAVPANTAVVEVAPPQDEPEEEPESPGTMRLDGDDTWSTFHGSPSRQGFSSARPIREPRIAWHAQVGIQSWLNSPIVLGNVVFVPSCGTAHNTSDSADGVYALELESGRQWWFTKLPQDANGAVVAPNHLIVTCDDGTVRSLNPNDGSEQWSASGMGKMYTHPLLHEDLVVVGDAQGHLRAYVARTGEARWTAQLAGAIRGGAASDGRHIYAVSQGGEAISLDTQGRQQWRTVVQRPAWDNRGTDEPIEAYSTPIVTERHIIVPFARDTYYTDAPALIALDRRTGNIAWRATGVGDWGNVRSTPALVDGLLVYAEPYSGDVVGIAADTGQMRYRRQVGPCYFPQWSSPAAAEGVVYVPRFGGTIVAVEPMLGKVTWELFIGSSTKIGQSQPITESCTWSAPFHALYSPAAIAPNGTLLVGSAEGLLYAIVDR